MIKTNATEVSIMTKPNDFINNKPYAIKEIISKIKELADNSTEEKKKWKYINSDNEVLILQPEMNIWQALINNGFIPGLNNLYQIYVESFNKSNYTSFFLDEKEILLSNTLTGACMFLKQLVLFDTLIAEKMHDHLIEIV